MSAGLHSDAAGLPPVNQALEPEWVRHGTPSTKKAYESALAFEKMLVEQLSQSLAATGGVDAGTSQEGEGGSEEGGSPQASAGAGELASLLPQALTGGVMRAGGLGLAAQMTHGLEGIASAASPHTRGATAAGAVAAPSGDAGASRGADTSRRAATTGGTSAP
jgi:hypothetical protein